jgi:hypothetical protein
MRSTAVVTVLCTLVVLLFDATVSSAGSIAYYHGAGYVDESPNGLGLASLGVSKLAWRHLEVTADVAYMHFDRGTVSFECFTGPCPQAHLKTSVIPVSIGLAGYLRGPRRSGPYGEFSPSLVVNGWSMEGGAGNGRFTKVTAGLKVGLGGRVAIFENGRLDLGVLYLLSGSGEIEDRAVRDATGRHRFDGLTEVVPFARLSITL